MKTKILISLCMLILISCTKAQLIVQTFSYTGSIQNFTVPTLCVNTLTIEARGAGGGSVTITCAATGGLGASMIGTFSVTPGQVLSILVGGVGGTNGADGGGGGGSFVVGSGNVPLLVAGGGGGATNSLDACGINRNGVNASITTSGTASGDNLVTGGINGNGGNATPPVAGGGGGFYTSGVSPGAANSGGKSYLLGAIGGTAYSTDFGGYGGGGAGNTYGGSGGGGGGYSGGGASGGTPRRSGGGGGSYNIGSNQVNTAGVQSGHGLVIISYYAGAQVTAVSSSSSVCNGSSAVLTASGTVSYTWSNGMQTPSITVSPSVTSVYTVSGTDPFNCIASSQITVNVNSLPVVAATSGSICSGNSYTIATSGASTYTFLNGSTVVSPLTNSSYSVIGTSSAGCISSNTAVATVTVINGPTLSVSNGTICIGESFTLQPSGTVSYVFSGGSAVVTPSTTSTYSITGINAQGCSSAPVIASVTVHPLPVISIASASAVCVGSSITLTGSGATSYTWSNNFAGSILTISPTSITTYSLLGIDSNGCSNTTQKTIVINSLPSLSISGNSVICQGVSTSLLVNGSALTYTWSDGTTGNLATVTPSASTIYTVTGTDINGCSNFTTQPILVNTLPAVNANANNTSICVGDVLILNGTGAVTYTWSSGVINSNPFYPSSTNTYSVTGTGTNSCKNSNSITVIVNSLPSLTITATPSTTICAGESLELNATGGNFYSWSTGDITPKITVTPTITTQYSVSGTDANGCSASKFFTQGVSECTSIFIANKSELNIKLFPNPNTGIFTISQSDLLTGLNLKIFNLQGEIILSKKINSSKTEIDLKEFASGFYFVMILNDKEPIWKEKIIKID